MTNRDACLGFLAGAIAGAAVAMLYAPQSGEETRNRIREVGLDAKAKAREAGMQAKEKLLEAKSGLEDSTGRVATAITRGREAFTDALAAKA